MDNSQDQRIKEVFTIIEEAKQRAGRGGETVEIIPISKNRSVTQIERMMEEGFGTFGENRVQELKEKHSLLQQEDLHWHMVGHLQRNKVKYIVRMKQCVMVQSLDSRRLAQKMEEELEKEGRIMDVLIQVNIAEDPKKYGFFAADLHSFLEEVEAYTYLKIKGLMTILPYVDNPEEVRPYFRRLSQLFLALKEEGIPNGEMKYLSMGMTNDYAIAIEEGANMIRVGSALFEPRFNKRGKGG